MNTLSAVAQIMAMAAPVMATTGAGGEASGGAWCFPSKTFTNATWYSAFIPEPYPGDKNPSYCSDIWLRMHLDGQAVRADTNWLVCDKGGAGMENWTELTIADEASCGGWVGRRLQAAFPQIVLDANVCGSKYPANVPPTCQLFKGDGNITDTKIIIPSSVDDNLAGRARAQLENDFPNDAPSWNISTYYKIETHGNRTDMHFVTGNVTNTMSNVTAHQEKLGRAWPPLTFDCVEMNTTSV